MLLDVEDFFYCQVVSRSAKTQVDRRVAGWVDGLHMRGLEGHWTAREGMTWPLGRAS